MDTQEPNRTDDWNSTLERLIVGISHHISNRVAILSGISDLLASDPAPPSPILRALSSEVPQLEEAIRLLRLLGDPEESLEAIEPIQVVRDALALAALHPDLKGITYTTEGEQAPPVFTRPVTTTHDLLIAITHAAAESDTGLVCVRLAVIGSDVVVTVGRYSVPMQTLLSVRSTTTS
jgi:signal transduction histidine kinase